MRIAAVFAATLLLLPGTAGTAPRQLDWADLLPESERAGYDPTPPAPTHDYLTGEGGLAAMQTMDFSINKSLEGQEVRLPGFIVPLELDAEGKVTEFFLVPYFGACIHVPPPPPNQLVFVVMNKGIALDTMYAAYWVTGKMTTRTKTTRLGAAAYTLSGTALEEYKY